MPNKDTENSAKESDQAGKPHAAVEDAALRFIQDNGESLAQHIIYYTSEGLKHLFDSVWAMIQQANEEHLFKSKEDAQMIYLWALYGIRIQTEMIMLHQAFGDTAIDALRPPITNKFTMLLGEDVFWQLMADAQDIVEENAGGTPDIILSVLSKRLLENQGQIPATLFQPVVGVLRNGGSILETVLEHAGTSD